MYKTKRMIIKNYLVLGTAKPQANPSKIFIFFNPLLSLRQRFKSIPLSMGLYGNM